jgi:three-Cys-motif partner protein
MNDADFFKETSEQSHVKALIVRDYFLQWARVMLGAQKQQGKTNSFAYIDLFAGPGQYEDGSDSTPLLVLKAAIENPEIAQSLVAIFNDISKSNADSLKQKILQLDGIELFATPPAVHNQEVTEKITKELKQRNLIPTLLFVDPWGYKGLTLDLLNAVLKNWGCDCIFFFNFNRINMGLTNPLVIDHMEALFGKARTEILKHELPKLKPRLREQRVLQEIKEALAEPYGKFFACFRFENDKGTKTSHYLIFVSKNFKGYDLMKHVMGLHSSIATHGVPSYSYNPPIKRHQLLLDLRNPIWELSNILLSKYAGRSLTFEQLYTEHSVGTDFIRANYKAALLWLEEQGKVSMHPSKRPMRKGEKTLADKVVITFPSKEV